MDLTSKQRAQLRGLANGIDTILIVGKDGIGDNLVKQANDALEARELIKGRVLENAMLTPGRRRRPWPPSPAARWCRSLEQNSSFTVQAIRRTRRIRLSWYRTKSGSRARAPLCDGRPQKLKRWCS